MNIKSFVINGISAIALSILFCLFNGIFETTYYQSVVVAFLVWILLNQLNSSQNNPLTKVDK